MTPDGKKLVREYTSPKVVDIPRDEDSVDDVFKDVTEFCPINLIAIAVDRDKEIGVFTSRMSLVEVLGLIEMAKRALE
jgi:hypothetical protein